MQRKLVVILFSLLVFIFLTAQTCTITQTDSDCYGDCSEGYECEDGVCTKDTKTDFNNADICEDATELGSCSEETPSYYCDSDLNLIPLCTDCGGCEAGYVCNPSTDECEEEEIIEGNCLEVIEGFNNEEENRINIVFLGVNYEEENEENFLLFINSIINEKGDYYGLFSVEPFKSNQDKFNFWYVDEITLTAEVESNHIVSGDQYIIDSLVEICSVENKYPLIVVNNYTIGVASFDGNAYADFIIQDIDSTIYETCPENDVNEDGCVDYDDVLYLEEEGLETPNEYLSECMAASYGCTNEGLDDPLLYAHQTDIKTAVHELGHSFGLLHDEDPHNLAPQDALFPYVNCYETDSEESCLTETTWSDLIGYGCGEGKVIDCEEGDEGYSQEVGCYEGCDATETGIYHPHLYTIMGTTEALETSNIDYTFGLVAERQLCDRIEYLTGDAGGYCEIFNSDGTINGEIYTNYFS